MMAKATISPNKHSMTVHDDILAWSVDLPHWQRDALRRIIEKGSFDDADTDELIAACREAHGLRAIAP